MNTQQHSVGPQNPFLRFFWAFLPAFIREPWRDEKAALVDTQSNGKRFFLVVKTSAGRRALEVEGTTFYELYKNDRIQVQVRPGIFNFKCRLAPKPKSA